MNKVLLFSAIGVAMSAMTMSAQTLIPYPSASLNMENNPGGLSSVEVSGSGLNVNRECKEFAILEKNGEVVKQIPASNKIAVYTFEGYTKNVPGSLHITFWDNLGTSPYKYTGKYKVTIPAGYFFLKDGSLSEEIKGEWGINNAELVFTPASGSTVNELKTVTVTFPGADAVKFNSFGYSETNPPTEGHETRSIFYDYSPANAEASEEGTTVVESGEIIPVISGNTAVLTMPEEYTSGTVTFTFGEGAFTVNYPGFTEASKNTLCSTKYTIMANSGSEDQDNAGWTITPPPGEVVQIPSAPMFASNEPDATAFQTYFVLYPPKDVTIGLPGRSRANLYEVVNGVRSKTSLKTFMAQKSTVDNTLLLYIPGEQSTPGSIKLPAGKYQLVVGANIDLTNRNPELVYEYDFTGETVINTKVTPSNEETLSEALDVITIEFPDSQDVQLSKGTYATITMDETVEYTAEVAVETIDEHPAIVVTPYTPMDINATYVVTIPGSNVLIDGVNYPISITYKVQTGSSTAVETVEAVTSHDIYSIDGRVVARNASAAAVKALNPGLYIINGHKVLIRK